MKTAEKVFIVPDFMITMIAIDDHPGTDFTQLHFESKITYSHLHEIKKLLETKKWIYITEDKRRRIPYLTEEGKKILANIYVLLDSMGISKADVYEYKSKEKRNDKEEKNKEIQIDIPTKVLE